MSNPSSRRVGALNRRRFLQGLTASTIGGFWASRAARLWAQDLISMPFTNGQRRLVRFPQKRPLILLTMRPPQLETPFAVFNEGILTPNDAFFVRYHLAQIPTTIDTDQFRLTINGKVGVPMQLSLAELKRGFDPVELVAVNQCSGNGRGLTEPRVPGGQLGNGAMGCARWRGVRLKDVLSRAGILAGARQIAFNGLDGPVLEQTPDFIKALEVDHALDGEVLLAYEMNGQELPMLNGYPLRLIVPGSYGTYWVKHLNEITVLAEEFTGYWMSTAYRVPDNAGACVEPGATPTKTRPIARLNVRSFITSLAEGATLRVGQPITVRGIAFDGGHGLATVRFSADGGKTWREADWGRDYGKYAFREWTISFTPQKPGPCELKACATNRLGQSQPSEPLWNPSGYMRNVVETVRVTAA